VHLLPGLPSRGPSNSGDRHENQQPQSIAKRLLRDPSRASASQVGVAHADCTDDWSRKCLRIQRRGSTPDTKLAIHAWSARARAAPYFRSGNSSACERYRSYGWNALLGEIEPNADLAVGSNATKIAQFTATTVQACPSAISSIALGRVPRSGVRDWHACDAADTAAQNASSGFLISTFLRGQRRSKPRLEFSSGVQ